MCNTMQFFYSFLLIAFCLAPSIHGDAIAKCKSLNHVDIDPGSAYTNNQCLLKCIIHGKTSLHEMNEGFPCPLASSGVSIYPSYPIAPNRLICCCFYPQTCQHGKCVQTGPKHKLGHIDIEIGIMYF